MTETDVPTTPFMDFRWSAPDVLLGAMTDTFDAQTEEVQDGTRITLAVGGALISGELIPAWQWSKEQAEAFAYFAEMSQDQHEWARLRTEAYELPPEDLTEAHEKADNSFAVHIHMKNAQVWHGLTPLAKQYWRVRMSRVDGWCFGSLGKPDGDGI